MGKGDLNIPLICVDAMLMLSDAELGRLTRAAVIYLSEDRELTLDGAERLVYAPIKANIDRDKEISEKRAVSGRKGGSKGKQKEANGSKTKQTEAKNSNPSLSLSPPTPPLISNSTQDTSPKEKPPKGGKKKAPFVPPTADEVRAYCLERGNGIDAEYFVSYYEARGWKYSGGLDMKDWKAAVRTWERREGGKRDVHDTAGDSGKTWDLSGVTSL